MALVRLRVLSGIIFFFFSSRRRHTRCSRDWSSDVCSSDLTLDTKLPNRYYMELLVNEKSWIEAYNGKSAWHQTAGGEPGTLVGPEGMQLEIGRASCRERV